MNWRFSDGTVATLGGNVEGASLFAQELREMLSRDRVGVVLGRIPGRGADLDKNDPALFDAWLRQEMGRPFRRSLKLKLLEAPDVPPLPVQTFEPIPEDALA